MSTRRSHEVIEYLAPTGCNSPRPPDQGLLAGWSWILGYMPVIALGQARGRCAAGPVNLPVRDGFQASGRLVCLGRCSTASVHDEVARKLNNFHWWLPFGRSEAQA